MQLDDIHQLSLQDLVYRLEGGRAHEQFAHFDPAQLAGMTALRITEIKSTKNTESASYFPDPAQLAGLYQLRIPLRYMLVLDNTRIYWYMLVQPEEQQAMVKMVEAAGHGFEVVPLVIESYPSQYSCCFLGIPPTAKKTRGQSILARLYHASAVNRRVFFVISWPVARENIQTFSRLLREKIESIQIEFLHGDVKNRTGRHAEQLLEYHLKRFSQSRISGLWQTGIYFYTRDPFDLQTGAGVIGSALYNAQNMASAIQMYPLSDSVDNTAVSGLLTGEELAGCFLCPGEEFVGLKNRERVLFDIDGPVDGTSGVQIGQILDNRRKAVVTAMVRLEDLNKHAFVTGVTGSGKTNSIFCILEQCWNHYHVPFLVIEPAKSEYRRLKQQLPELDIYSIGTEKPDLLAFRLNPFYFDEKTPLQTHIDHLKNVFFATFVLYPPMPYVLETCLYHVYLDKGWNLITGQNSRGVGPGSWPTLDDLYDKIRIVVADLGYEKRLAMDIRAALQTRVNSLRIGTKGLMLNTAEKANLAGLFTKPAVFELKNLGDEDEKAFFMALLLMFMFEWREFRPVAEKLHLLVIEEAHRLLRNIDMLRNPDQSSVKAKGIEFFCNMLAEMRAKNQGMIIADQIPVQLAPAVLKNTNLKIVHRLVAFDDREAVGRAMMCNEAQRRQFGRLVPGEAVIYKEGMDAPNLARIDFDEKLNTLPAVGDTALPENMNNLPCDTWAGSNFQYQWQKFLHTRRARFWNARLYIELLFAQSAGEFIACVLELLYDVKEFFLESNEEQQYQAMEKFLSYYIHKRGAFYAWPFARQNEVFEKVKYLLTLVRSAPQNNDKLYKGMKEFEEYYRRYCTGKEGPFAGCRFCSNVCIHRYEGSTIAMNSGLDGDIKTALRIHKYTDLLNLVQFLAGKVYSGGLSAVTDNLVVCILNHKTSHLKISRRTAYEIINHIKKG